jgi:hypothetical protein
MENSVLNIGLAVNELVVGNCYRISLRGVNSANANNGNSTPAPGPALTFVGRCTTVDADENMATFATRGATISVSLSLYKVIAVDSNECSDIQSGGVRKRRRQTRKRGKQSRRRRHQSRRR